MVEQLYRQLGQRIRAFRKQATLTIEQLAEQASLDTQYVGFIERGQGKPSLDALQRIAKALGVEIVELEILSNVVDEPAYPDAVGLTDPLLDSRHTGTSFPSRSPRTPPETDSPGRLTC